MILNFRTETLAKLTYILMNLKTLLIVGSLRKKVRYLCKSGLLTEFTLSSTSVLLLWRAVDGLIFRPKSSMITIRFLATVIFFFLIGCYRNCNFTYLVLRWRLEAKFDDFGNNNLPGLTRTPFMIEHGHLVSRQLKGILSLEEEHWLWPIVKKSKGDSTEITDPLAELWPLLIRPTCVSMYYFSTLDR